MKVSVRSKEGDNQEMRELYRSLNIDEVMKYRRLRWLIKQSGWTLRVAGESELFLGQCNVHG
jgi:hypothetical protein